MAKKALLDVLEKTIGQYVKNLDAESLNVAVWSGKIELNGLILDVDNVNGELARHAMNAPNLAVPFRVISGQFDKFEVDVPWAHLMSRPVVMRAKGLHVSIEPCDRINASGNRRKDDGLHLSKSSSSDGDGEDDKKNAGPKDEEAAILSRIRDDRTKSIKAADDYRRQANALRKLAEKDLEASSGSNSSDRSQTSNTTSSTFSSRLVRRMVENMQVEIHDVHIALQGTDSSAGVQLESFSLVTTDKDGNRTFVDRSAANNTETASIDLENAFLHKQLQITGFGIYLDEDRIGHALQVQQQHQLSLVAIQEEDSSSGLGKARSGSGGLKQQTRTQQQQKQHSYLLAPLSFQAKLRQADSNVCIEYPKYSLTSELTSLDILLSRKQLEMANNIAQQIRPNTYRPLLFPEYRPLLGKVTKSNSREWWLYAYKCIGRLNGRRSMWVEVLHALRSRKSYVPLYKRHAYHESYAWLSPLSPTEVETLERIEQDRLISVDGIMTWRNIVDAQVELENEKHESRRASTQTRGSLFSSLFGTSSSSQTQADDGDDDPPITLTETELKELEDAVAEKADNGEGPDGITQDSRLCDVQFVLGSFRINLSSQAKRPLALLEMGTVATAFDANADGSFNFKLDMTSLEIQDRFTPKTLFPSVLKSQPRRQQSDLASTKSSAFGVSLAKSKAGDQKLHLHLNTFEIVASPLWVAELKRFLTVSSSTRLPTSSSSFSFQVNPLLAQSMSGSIDLFYDAPTDAPPRTVNISGDGGGIVPDSTRQQKPTSDFSAALIDAWKSKTEAQSSLIVDCDIYAPILVVPANCIDARANVLVFDFGHLEFNYGIADTPPKVNQWFKEHPRMDVEMTSPVVLDAGSLTITRLTFRMGKANYWHRLVRKLEAATSSAPHPPSPSSSLLSTVAAHADDSQDAAILEPISMVVDFGVETRAKDDVPRICCVSVLRSIGLCLSSKQLSRIMDVINSWKKVKDEILGGNEDFDGNDDNEAKSHVSGSTSALLDKGRLTLAAMSQSLSTVVAPVSPFSRFWVDMRLQRLSVKIATDAEKHGLEAHLVSATAFASCLSDGSLESRLSMGWFWVIDRLENSFARHQRLVAHSKLPSSSEDLAREGKYDIIQDLEQLGVFDDKFGGSTDLADITIKLRSPDKAFGEMDPFAVRRVVTTRTYDVDIIVDAKFTSLYVNWNPRAVKKMTSVLAKFSEQLDSSGTIEEKGPVVVSSPTRERSPSFVDEAKENERGRPSVLLIHAEMDRFEVSLNSALDDLPLFVLTMAKTRVSVVSSGCTKALAELGDLTVVTPGMGRTNEHYRTILGLAPGQSDSLLSVEYFDGKKAMAPLAPEGVDLSDCEAYAEVELSPMRLVHIQAQTLALVEYATAGILGALASQAANSAAAAAAELAKSAGSKKLFRVKATGVDIVLPQAAYRTTLLAARSGGLQVDFFVMPDSGSVANIILSDFGLQDTVGSSLLGTNVRMEVGVTMPPVEVGTEEEKAMRVKVGISRAPFVISKKQYAQLLATLSENLGEPDLFLRDETVRLDRLNKDVSSSSVETAEKGPNEKGPNEGLTHAGIAVVEITRRLYIDVNVAELSLGLCRADPDDPIALLSAVDASIGIHLLSDEGRTMFEVKLKDLICEDQRLASVGRQHRSLIYQPTREDDESKESSSQGDVFFASYETREDKSTTIELAVGSPRIVFIPDAVADSLAFLQPEGSVAQPTEANPPRARASPPPPAPQSLEVVRVDADNDSQGVETSVVVQSAPSPIAYLKFTMKTARCSVILVDLGSDIQMPAGVRRSVAVSKASAETFVLTGMFESQLAMQTEVATGTMKSLDAQLHCDEIEAYTAFGRELGSALQVLDPSKFSFYAKVKRESEYRTVSDFRIASITPLDITLSMRNVALLNAVLASLSESVDESDSGEVAHVLSQHERDRIEKLASALERDDSEAGSFNQASEVFTTSPSVTQSGVVPEKDCSTTSVKVTMPETQMTFVNDLQGLDEALFRFSIRSAVANAQVRYGESITRSSPVFTGFDFMINMSLISDYFDASSHTWEVLLQKPWEISLKGARGARHKFQSKRPSTSMDVEAFPCHLSFSEQFLMSLASANRTWSLYSSATTSAHASLPESLQSNQLRRSMAASAARTFVLSLPYAVDNQTGCDGELHVNGEKRHCVSGSIEYFRFEPPRGTGSAGKRLYGQDVTFDKAVRFYIGDFCIRVDQVDSQIGATPRFHNMKDGRIVMTDVEKEGKTVVIYVSSGVNIQSSSVIPFSIGTLKNGVVRTAGVCTGGSSELLGAQSSSRGFGDGGRLSRFSRRLGIPVDLIQEFRLARTSRADSTLSLAITPQLQGLPSGWQLSGRLDVSLNGDRLGNQLLPITNISEVVCKPVRSDGTGNTDAPRSLDPFVLQARLSIELIGNEDVTIEVLLSPRAVIQNELPIGISVRSPMPHIFRNRIRSYPRDDESVYDIDQGALLEIFTPGPSVSVAVGSASLPVAGTPTGWMDSGWIDLPLVAEFRLPEPIRCSLPFVRKAGEVAVGAGQEFFILEGNPSSSGLSDTKPSAEGAGESAGIEVFADPTESLRTFFVTLRNYAVDHTGGVLFEQLESRQKGFEPTPNGAYGTARHSGRISLLPGKKSPIRLLHLTMEGDDGLRKSMPFCMHDIAISDGGVSSTAIKWEDGGASGYCAYQQLVSSYQSELHVIPEFVVFNGSEQEIVVRQPGGADMSVRAGTIAPLRGHDDEVIIISVGFLDVGGRIAPLRIDALGIRVAIVKAADGSPIGSVAIQTVVGSRDSRLVVKLGAIKYGSLARESENTETLGAFENDFMRFRIQWSELRLMMKEARPFADKRHAFLESALDSVRDLRKSNRKQESWVQGRSRRRVDEPKPVTGQAICTILLYRFTVDWQRVFKDVEGSQKSSVRNALLSPERSQLSVIVHSIRITDNTPGSKFPVVFDTPSSTVNFFDLCVRIRGPFNSDLVKVDLFDLNLAHVNGVSEAVILSTSEDFVWKMMDLVDRIIVAAGEFSGFDIELQWDEEHGGYKVSIRDAKSSFIEDSVKYTPPKSDTLYSINTARVSPFKIVVSFKRNPQASRYELLQGGGAHIINYFTTQLKFTIDRAELKFARYEARNMKGPADRLVESIKTVYISRAKTKFITIMTAASYQDWKYLASRDGGDDEFVEGDLLRATGNIAGKTVSYVLKKSSQGIGKGLVKVTTTLGDGIENASSAVGAGRVGAGVNSVVTGVGVGVADTLTGVGTGAGKVLKGAGQGVGQVVGGVTGGALLIGKGIGKGIKHGDGTAVVSGITDGVASVGAGVGQGVESVVTGAAGGVVSVGKGLFSGVKNVGMGLGGAITGKKLARKPSKKG